MDPLFQEMIGTLQEAREALRVELELLQDQAFDSEALLRLLEATRSFADQADSLVLLITDRGAEEAWLSHANDLAAFFWETEETVAAMLGLAQD